MTEIDKIVLKRYPMPKGACRITKTRVEAQRKLLRERLIKEEKITNGNT